VLPTQPIETAQAIAQHYRAGFVLLDAERQIARVVFEQATADFALQVGPSLTTDLERRDFTVNAIAYDPYSQKIIDPLQGYADLKQGVLRMVSARNLAEDPLRLLRAYRQAAQLDFTLETETQAQIRQLAPCLKQVAAERVRVELSYLLSSAAGTPFLAAAWEDGLLQHWFPAASAAGLAQIAAMDQAAQMLAATWPELQADFQCCITELTSQHLRERAYSGEASRRTLLATAKLTGLLKPQPQPAIVDLQQLKYSRTEIQLVTTLLKCLAQVTSTVHLTKLSRREQYFLFQRAGRAFSALAVLVVALGTSVAEISPLIDQFLDPENAIAHPTPLITGKVLIDTLKLSPGPQIGKLLAALELAQAEGKITTAEEALELAKELSNLANS
jgi:tRNA nucleotidyltransferase (CCA-adding enzyme)